MRNPVTWLQLTVVKHKSLSLKTVDPADFYQPAMHKCESTAFAIGPIQCPVVLLHCYSDYMMIEN